MRVRFNIAHRRMAMEYEAVMNMMRCGRNPSGRTPCFYGNAARTELPACELPRDWFYYKVTV